MAKTEITATLLREVLNYNADTGVFTWLARRTKTNGRFALSGKDAGHVDRHGYRIITMGGGIFAAGRLAWLHMTGTHPSGVIDHINGDPLDNRWENLRDVSNTENLQNQRHAKTTNKSGLLGVTSQKHGFTAEIQSHKQRHYLGWFTTAQEAHDAYVEAKRRLHATCTL